MKMIGDHVMIQLLRSGTRRRPCKVEYAACAGDRLRVWTPYLRRGLDAEDLRERRAADLELALVGLARADHALELEARAAQRAGERVLGVALAPGEDLDRRGGRGDRDAGARHRARPLERAAHQQRARPGWRPASA